MIDDAGKRDGPSLVELGCAIVVIACLLLIGLSCGGALDAFTRPIGD